MYCLRGNKVGFIDNGKFYYLFYFLDGLIYEIFVKDIKFVNLCFEFVKDIKLLNYL